MTAADKEEEPIDPTEYERVRAENQRIRREHSRLYREYQRLTADYKTYKAKLDEQAVQAIEQQAQAAVTQAESALSRQPLITNLPRVTLTLKPKDALGRKRKQEADEEEMAKRQKVAEAKAKAAKEARELAIIAELAPLSPDELLKRLCTLLHRERPVPPTPEGSGTTWSCIAEVDGESVVGQGITTGAAKNNFTTEALLKIAKVATVDDARMHIRALKLKTMKKQ
eukprot:TRINITY_DN12750_c0_g1_i1.p1 TRINITY_DN12750_c0_g1~~TRINITY_DN12750_c0_g1_i1.p1  ORF type:complete len:255 (+),score=91.07 TRINITY_DN12750_c0_g1_i1:90-767(+)